MSATEEVLIETAEEAQKHGRKIGDTITVRRRPTSFGPFTSAITEAAVMAAREQLRGSMWDFVRNGAVLPAFIQEAEAGIKALHDAYGVPVNSVTATFNMPPAPERTAIQRTEGLPNREYAALCREVGVLNPAALQLEIEDFLAEHIPNVYPMKAVEEYMDALVLKENEERRKRLQEQFQNGYAFGYGHLAWDWCPLRKSDVVMAENHNVITNSSKSEGPNQYTKSIPPGPLHTIKLVNDHFGERVGLFISDYGVKMPDPFAVITGPELPGWCIDKWDEPGFTW